MTTVAFTPGWGTKPWGAPSLFATPLEITSMIRGQPFFAAEIAIRFPGSATVAFTPGWGTKPWGAPSLVATPLEATSMIRASDTGYRTRASDAGGVVSYPPRLTQGFQIDREINLDITSAGASAAWGSLLLSNVDGAYDQIAAGWNADRRVVSVLYGAKAYDAARGLFVDPPYASLVPLLRGLGSAWFLGETDLQMPLRDATYWLDAPVQSSLYAGTGAYEGPSTMAGQPKPMARGGTAGNPIRNVTPVLVDPVALIYQYTDGPGTVVALYEGAALTIAAAGDTNNLYAGSTPAGHYRTDNSRGLFQLGSVPASGYAITCDVTGAFPLAGAHSTVLSIARYLMTEDLGLPAAYLDLGSLAVADAAYPYTAGVWFGPQAVTASVALAQIYSSIGAKLVPMRDGTLGTFVLRALAGTEGASARLDTTNIVSLTPQPLPDTLAPAPYRIRVGYQHNNTVQATGLNTATATVAQQQFVASADRYGTWISTANELAYGKPSDPDPVTGALLVQADAGTVANALDALWGAAPRTYDVEVPLAVGLALDLGQPVLLRYPTGTLRNGRLGQVVGDRVISTEATMTLRILT